MSWIQRLLSPETLAVIVDVQTRCIQVISTRNAVEYLDDLQTWSTRPTDLQLLAVAHRFGKAIKLARLKLKPWHLRGSWYSQEAYEIIVRACTDAPVLDLKQWLHELIEEVNDTGIVGPIEAEHAPTQPNSDLFDNTQLKRVTGRCLENVEVYSHPKRRPGRPRKALPYETVERPQRRPGRPRKAPSEKHRLNGDQIQIEASKSTAQLEESATKPIVKPPAWALSLARRAPGSGPTDNEA